MRVDAFIWAVRIYKSRSLASSMCKSGKVKIKGDNIKPSRDVKKGEVIECKVGSLTKTIKVLDFPKSRVGAKLVKLYMRDLTSDEEYARVKELRIQQTPMKNYDGKGRPTKKVRRDLDEFRDE